MSLRNRVGFAFLASVCVLPVGCKEATNEKAVYKVTGTVMVDGKAAEGVQVTFHDNAGVDKERPTFPQGVTEAQGKVKLSTYADGDGAPQGEYKITYSWQEFNVMSRSYSGQDKLNKKYSDPKTTPFTLKVGSDQKNDLGNVELTTSKK